MSRISICITTALTACATAGPDDGTRGQIDAANQNVDAPSQTTDAPSIDAPPIDAFVDLCPSAATCATAIVLGSVDGDSGSQKVTAAGYQSAWYRVRVNEDDSSPIGQELQVTARLTSPSAVEFDVFLYVNKNSDVVQCVTPSSTSSTVGNVTTTSVDWGEGSVANGDDDGRTVSVEVRPISGVCGPSAMWQLEVEGN